MNLVSFGFSDIGTSRSNNEDVWIALPEIGFFALADGMGGSQAGEIAAKEAVHLLSDFVLKIKSHNCMELIIELRHAIEKVNQSIYQMGQESESMTGMGTTLCCLIWTLDAVVYAHVGDSRIYRLRNKKLELLTQDHSLLAKWLATGKLAEECETPYPYKNVITRAVGTSSKAKPEIAVTVPEPQDLYFLCTDGLSDVLSLQEMEKIINHSKDLESSCKSLIERAKIKGSCDNITLLMIQKMDVYGENLPRQQLNHPLRSESLQGHVDGSQGPSS
jgi:serine/threonine protein phosphatase PrpC